MTHPCQTTKTVTIRNRRRCAVSRLMLERGTKAVVVSGISADGPYRVTFSEAGHALWVDAWAESRRRREDEEDGPLVDGSGEVFGRWIGTLGTDHPLSVRYADLCKLAAENDAALRQLVQAVGSAAVFSGGPRRLGDTLGDKHEPQG